MTLTATETKLVTEITHGIVAANFIHALVAQGEDVNDDVLAAVQKIVSEADLSELIGAAGKELAEKVDLKVLARVHKYMKQPDTLVAIQAVQAVAASLNEEVNVTINEILLSLQPEEEAV
jgi:hypothetical protein